MPDRRKTKQIDDSDLQHSWSSKAVFTETSFLSNTLWLQRNHRHVLDDYTLCVLSIVCVCARPLYPILLSPTVPAGSPHYPLDPSSVSLHRTLPLYPPYPFPSYPFSQNFTQPSLHLRAIVSPFCTFVNQCRTFVDQLFGYSGWGRLVRYKGYSGTEDVERWYSAEGTVVQCRGILVQQGGCGGTV